MQLFDSWDDDGGGSLDLKELRSALTKLQEAARAWRDVPDPNRGRVEMLRRRASDAEDAAKACATAEAAEFELERFRESLLGRADVQLGALLYRRKVKPGAVVTQWARSKGEHAGELSKSEFREACISLGLKAMANAEIDRVFDMYDEDGGGYMDQDEAKTMIKGLQKIAEDAEHEKYHKTVEAQTQRRNASKKAISAIQPVPAATDSDAASSPMSALSPNGRRGPHLPAGGTPGSSQSAPSPTGQSKKNKKKKRKGGATGTNELTDSVSPAARRGGEGSDGGSGGRASGCGASGDASTEAAASSRAPLASRAEREPAASSNSGTGPSAKLMEARERARGGAAPAQSSSRNGTPVGAKARAQIGGALSGVANLIGDRIETILSSRRERGGAQQPRAAADVVAFKTAMKAAARIGKLQLARGFSTWRAHTEQTTRQLATASRLVRAMRSLDLNAAFIRWAAHARALGEGLAAVDASVRHLQHWPEAQALRKWLDAISNNRMASSVPRLTSGDLAKRASGATLCDAAARCLASMAPCVK